METKKSLNKNSLIENTSNIILNVLRAKGVNIYDENFSQEELEESVKITSSQVDEVLKKDFFREFKIEGELSLEMIKGFTKEQKEKIPQIRAKVFSVLELKTKRNNVERINNTMGSTEDYGEHTWTNQQTVIDLLFQNALDANTVMHYEKMRERIFNKNIDKKIGNLLLYQLYQWVKTGSDIKKPQEFNAHKKYLNPEFLDEGEVNLQKLFKIWENNPIPLPKVKYEVYDKKEDEILNLTLEQLREDKYYKKITEPIVENRYQIKSIEVQDQGSGFDHKLMAFYSSDKNGIPYLRGQYGEGSKMGLLHTLRNKIKVKVRSKIIDPKDNKKYYWQIRPSVDSKSKDKEVFVKGAMATIDQENEEDFETGTSIKLILDDLEIKDRDEILSFVDPRKDKGGLIDLISDYDSESFEYFPDEGNIIGIKEIHETQKYAHLQGLKIGLKYTELAFDYDFHDPYLLMGRDRSFLNSIMVEEKLNLFWTNCKDQKLIFTFFKKILFQNLYSVTETIEFQLTREYPNMTIDMLNKLNDEQVRELFGLEKDKTNILVEQNDWNGELHQEAQSKKNKNLNFICIGISMSEFSKFLKNKGYKIKNLRDSFKVDKKKKKDNLSVFDKRYREVSKVFESIVHRVSGYSKIPGILVKNSSEKETGYEIKSDGFDIVFEFNINPKDENPIEKIKLKEGALALEIEGIMNNSREGESERFNTAQNVAQKKLDTAAKRNEEDWKNFPKSFDHVSGTQNKSWINRLSEIDQDKLKLLESLQDPYSNKTKEEWSEFKDALKELDRIEKSLTFYLPVDKALKRIFYKFFNTKRPVKNIIGDTLEIYTFMGHKPKIKKISELKKIKENGEIKAYQIDSESILLLQDHHEIEGLKIKGESFFIKDGKIYNKDGILQNQERIKITEKGLLISEFNERKIQYRDLEILEKNKEKPFISTETEVIKTNVNINYGIGEWDDPFRVWKDIYQNHVDEDPNAKFECMVLRKGQEEKIKVTELTPNDEILGIFMTDDGNGYAPESVRLLGKSGKQNPFTTGKHGEGTTLVATAAVRNGMILEYTSSFQEDGKNFRWKASTFNKKNTPIAEPIIGKDPIQNLVFYKTTKEEKEKSYKSSTLVRLPKNPTKEQKLLWKDWTDVLKPKEETILEKLGNSFKYRLDWIYEKIKTRKSLVREKYKGVEKHIRALRAKKQDVIEFGISSLLKDKSERGQIYDNGFWIGKIDTLFGWDIPGGSATRERNIVDSYMVKKHAASFWENNFSEKLGNLVMDEIIRLSHQEEKIPIDIEVLEYIPKHSPNYWKWRKLFQKTFGNKIVFEAGRNTDSMIKDHHLTKEQVLPIGRSILPIFAHFMPNSTDYSSLSNVESVEVSPEDIVKLKNIMAGSAAVMAEKLNEIKNDPEKYKYFKEFMKDDIDILIKNIKRWQKGGDLYKDENSVFITTNQRNYDGMSIGSSQIGISESYLNFSKINIQKNKRFIGVIRHELVHAITGLNDYDPAFIYMLNAMGSGFMEKNTKRKILLSKFSPLKLYLRVRPKIKNLVESIF